MKQNSAKSMCITLEEKVVRLEVFNHDVRNMTETDEGENKKGFEEEEEEEKEPAKFMIGASEDEFPDYEFEEVIATNHVVPPDGGWGWVVVAASFLCNVVVDGIIFSTGLLLKDFQEQFPEISTSQVSWVSSLLGGFYLIVGPFVSGLANAYGFRVVCILGAILGALAFGASYFAPNIYFLYISFGIVGGTGFGLIYVPAVIATGFYFEKKRALATGIAVCGSGIGTFIFAPLNTNLLASMGWRWTLVVYACVVSSCAIYGLAFRPLEPNSLRTPDDDVDPPGTPLLMRIKKARDEQMKQCASALSMASMASNRSPSRLTMEETALGPMPNGDFKLQGGTVAKTLLERHGGAVGAGAKRFSFPGIVVTTAEEPIIEEEGEEGPDGKPRVLDKNENETDLKTQTVGTTTTPTTNTTATTPTGERSPRQLTQRARYPRIESAPVLANHYSHHYDHQRRPSRLALRTEMARPFYREDIFFSGSMNRIPQYQSSETVDKYHASVTQLPPMAVIAEEEASKTCCRCCPTAMVYIINKMFDFSLLASPTFIVLCIAGSMSLLALFIPFMFLPGYAEMQGADAGTRSTLVLLIGIANTAGRVICGGLSDHPKVDALYVNNLSLIMGGVATIALPFLKDISLMYAYSLVFGFAVAAFASLRSILLVELLGLEKLTNAFGLLLLFQGIAAVFGGPIAGAFYDSTKTYNMTFWVFGSIFALSGIICVPLRWLKRWEDRRLQKKQEEYNQA
ncbi:monocarboxylate transporter 5 isoform X2 [Oratosquilla oratoria]|uniref:monocarboxylate transporter 5 isoform X2 n=1 Tax=Oratosquilla oratoria TaxID=337810 RepID=UPI003F76C6F8